MRTQRLAIIGCGDLAQQIAYHALNDGHYEPVGFFDDFASAGVIKYGLPVIGKIDDVNNAFLNGKFDVLMIGLGYRHFELKEALFNRFVNQIPFGRVLHSSSYIDPSCRIGQGVFIYPGCTLDMNSVVEDNALLNVGCVIAHDTTIGKHSFLSPSVKVAGFVRIGRKVSLGIGTVVVDNIEIYDSVRTGAGAVVIGKLEVPGLYVGIPAVFKKS